MSSARYRPWNRCPTRRWRRPCQMAYDERNCCMPGKIGRGVLRSKCRWFSMNTKASNSQPQRSTVRRRSSSSRSRSWSSPTMRCRAFPRHHVIDGTLKLDSRSSWHTTSGTRAALEFNEKPKTKSDTSGRVLSEHTSGINALAGKCSILSEHHDRPSNSTKNQKQSLTLA